jgi:ParB family chromosome partitioning protein
VSRRSGLGRGLNSLIPQGAPAASDSKLREIPLTQIRPNPLQPRKHFDEEALATLVDSVKAVGILQPVLVREVGPDEYELIAGERRFRAARRAGLSTVPALVHAADGALSLEQALVENLHRENLNPLEEAGAYQQLIEDFDLTHEEVARRVGRSRVSITNSLRLFQLPPIVQRHVRDGRLSAGHARALLGTPDREAQEALAQAAISGGLSVRAVEDQVRRLSAASDESSESASLVPGEQPGEASRSSSEASDDLAGAGFGEAEDDPATAPAGRVARLRPPGVLDLEEMLGDHLNTRVTVDMGGKRGKVVIEFATLDDLERIYRVIIGGQSPEA